MADIHTDTRVVSIWSGRSSDLVEPIGAPEKIGPQGVRSPDVIACIRIELRRGGQVSHVVEGMTPRFATRFASRCVLVMAEMLQMVNRHQS